MVVMAPVTVLVIFALHGLLWVTLVAVALIVLARRAVADGADLLGVAGKTGPRHWWPGSPPSMTCRSW